MNPTIFLIVVFCGIFGAVAILWSFLLRSGERHPRMRRLLVGDLDYLICAHFKLDKEKDINLVRQGFGKSAFFLGLICFAMGLGALADSGGEKWDMVKYGSLAIIFVLVIPAAFSGISVMRKAEENAQGNDDK